MISAAQQIPLDLGHRPAQGREDFLIAPNNQEAVGWIDRWPEWPAPTLILHGPVASGKSHLAAVWAEKNDAAFIDTATLASSDANGLAQKGKHLVLDHIDPWFGDRDAETTLFHLYNIMKEEGRTFLLTTRMAPSHVDFTIADLASRLRAAPVATIHPPDDMLITALLVKLFSDRQIQINDALLKYILPRMERSFAAAHNLVEKADHLALAEKKPVSVPIIRRILLD